MRRNFLMMLLTQTTHLLAVIGVLACGFAVGSAHDRRALRVPEEHQTIQAALDAAEAGDVVVVAPGTYKERLRLKQGVTLKSAGDDARGSLGLQRAETTILDGNFSGAKGAGVAMAEDSTLDGFTVTGVGEYDDARWKKHHATQGNDQPHEHIGAPGVAGIAIDVARCTVTNNIVHHIGYTGIAIVGADGKRVAPLVLRNIAYRNMGGGIGSMKKSQATIEANTCFENFYAGIGHEDASPLVINNLCHSNIRAGIGISEGAAPILRGNKCYKNRRAGIGIRTGAATRPIVESNECYDNDMAGIGCEEGCTPILRDNRCYGNQLAGIGCRDHAIPLIVGNRCYRNQEAGIGSEKESRPIIVENECYENARAGIGQRESAQTILIGNQVHHNQQAGIGFEECQEGRSIVLNNRLLENGAVAIGIHAGWKVRAIGNELSRPEGMPPVVMVFAGAEADFTDNTFRGSGVAGIRSEGIVRATSNTFESAKLRVAGPPQFALWGLPGSHTFFSNNQVRGWRHAVFAERGAVTACENRVAEYGSVAIKVNQPTSKVVAVGNEFSSDRDREGVNVTGGSAITDENRITQPGKDDRQAEGD